MHPKEPTEIDCLVGGRVRERRMRIGLSQGVLAEALGITVPQLQKYEKGINRIGASRLHKIASVLEVPITCFFEPLESAGASRADADQLEAQPVRPDPSLFADRETIELVMAFSRITRPEVRRALLDLARAVAGLSPAAADEPANEA
jgi:transcriptional regulator with XRE-family HTH domain